MNHEHLPCPMKDRVVWVDEQAAELMLLLPEQQAAELERLAHSRGQTTGQLIRQLIRDFLTGQDRTAPVSNWQGAGYVAVRRGVRFDPHAPIPRRGDL
jgi:hypothetical protein